MVLELRIGLFAHFVVHFEQSECPHYCLRIDIVDLILRLHVMHCGNNHHMWALGGLYCIPSRSLASAARKYYVQKHMEDDDNGSFTLKQQAVS